MLLLHTSDWHFGRSFGGHRLLDDQAAFTDWLVDTVAQRGVEVVVVSGDLFDRAVPPAEAVTLLFATFRRLTAVGATVVAIAGNHDSAARLAAHEGLTEASGVVIRAGYDRAGQVDVLTLPSGRLAVAAVPFLDPLLAPAELVQAHGRTHGALLARALEQARSALPAGVPSLAVAHAFVAGGAPSGSERDLSVGGVVEVDPAAFEGFDYVALGHLHRPQRVAGHHHIRYAGSPLAYSFSETGPKQVGLVDLSGLAPAVESLPVPVGRRVRTLRGAFDDLLADQALADLTDTWVRVELTDVTPVLDAARLLRERFPLLVELERVGLRAAAGEQPDPVGVAERLAPLELAARFWADVTGSDLPPAERALLAGVLDDARVQEHVA